jgi:hypothetical protein
LIDVDWRRGFSLDYHRSRQRCVARKSQDAVPIRISVAPTDSGPSVCALFWAHALLGIAQQVCIAPRGKSFPSRLDRRRVTRWRRAIAIRFEAARQWLSAISSKPVFGNNPKQVGADELCGFHCSGARSKMTAISSALVVPIRDGAMRNYSRIFRGKGVAGRRSIRQFWRRGTSTGRRPIPGQRSGAK